MPIPRVAVAVDADTVHDALVRLRSELEITIEHPPDARAEADAASRSDGWRGDGRADRTGIELVTIDPPGSRDLDQAFTAERRGDGYRVWYAIADVAAFVKPGGALDAECHRRGVTLYAPDRRAPLHPPVLSEGAASLLPDGDRPALLWCIDLDRDGEPVATRLERAIVRSRAQLAYAEVDRVLAAGTAPEPLVLLREIGQLRILRERARGGVSLPLPEQIVEPDGGQYRLTYDAPLPSEEWNAQISLLAGMEAARIMLDGGAGILRTLDPPDPVALDHLQTAAAALGIAWPQEGGYPELVRSLDPASPEGAALLVQATRVLRGAGYRGFRDGDIPQGDNAVHSAVAAPYAHVTAPLRRLCDRAANEAVLAHVEGRAVPEWAARELDTLPAVMADARRRESAYSRATLDLVEALVLCRWVGHTFAAVVVDVDERANGSRRAQVHLREPAVVAWARAETRPNPGDEVSVVLRAADPIERRIELDVVER